MQLFPSLALVGLLAAPPAVPIDNDDYVLVEVGTFQQPLLVTAPNGDDRLFVVERGGQDDIASFHTGTGNWVVSRSTDSGFANSVWTK